MKQGESMGKKKNRLQEGVKGVLDEKDNPNVPMRGVYWRDQIRNDFMMPNIPDLWPYFVCGSSIP